MDQLVIMCGGRGKRLKKNIPKALIKINNKTILEHQLILAKKHKFKKIILLTGYKSNEIKNFLITKKLFRNITILRDKKKVRQRKCYSKFYRTFRRSLLFDIWRYINKFRFIKNARILYGCKIRSFSGRK